jgi:hypothetical protein
MPSISLRKKVINGYKKAASFRLKLAVARWFLDIDNPAEDIIDRIVINRLNELHRRRYIYRLSIRQPTATIPAFLTQMRLGDEGSLAGNDNNSENSSGNNWFDDNDFKREYRMSRESFLTIHSAIKGHAVFQPKRFGTVPMDSKMQLLIFLRYIGLSGNGGSNQRMRHFFHCGAGMIQKAKNQVLEAILSLRPLAIKWPDNRERSKIEKRFRDSFQFPNLVFIADGTLFPLASKPRLADAADYSGRKLGYTINAIILCDDQRRVRDYLAGNPGTCHDERAFKQMPICRQSSDFLDETQYGIGDSAFTPRSYLIPAFKKPINQQMPAEHEEFNTILSRPRVIIEHVNGMLKSRFKFLTLIPMVLKDRHSLQQILKHVDACIILHNMLINLKDDIPDSWYEGDDVSEIDEQAALEFDELNTAVPIDSENTTRREQLMVYFNWFGT